MEYAEIFGKKPIRFYSGGQYETTITHDGPIKIGFSGNGDYGVENRRLIHDQHSPWKIELIGVIHGDMVREKEIHNMFANCRIRPDREWFYPNPELLTFIQSQLKKRRPRKKKEDL